MNPGPRNFHALKWFVQRGCKGQKVNLGSKSPKQPLCLQTRENPTRPQLASSQGLASSWTSVPAAAPFNKNTQPHGTNYPCESYPMVTWQSEGLSLMQWCWRTRGIGNFTLRCDFYLLSLQRACQTRHRIRTPPHTPQKSAKSFLCALAKQARSYWIPCRGL